MASLDIPAMLILVLLVGALMWALYNWTHPMTGSRR